MILYKTFKAFIMRIYNQFLIYFSSYFFSICAYTLKLFLSQALVKLLFFTRKINMHAINRSRIKKK